MKNRFIVGAALFIIIPALAQSREKKSKDCNSAKVKIHVKADSDTSNLLNGKLRIITKEKDGERSPSQVELTTKKDTVRKVLETSWGSFDIGFNNYTDNTNYANPGPLGSDDAGFLAKMNPAANVSDFELRSGKSVHINIGIVKQQLSLYKNYINIVYGLTYDISNWSYKRSIDWNKAPENQLPIQGIYQGPYVSRDSNDFRKNRLVTNYLQVPLMLRIETSPHHTTKNVYISAGGYVGYLVRSHTKKMVQGSTAKIKQYEDFNLNKFQYGMQFEVGYQGVAIFVKQDLTPMTSYGTVQYPYSFGLRITGL